MNIAFTNNRQARVAYDDLRDWIEQADRLGEMDRLTAIPGRKTSEWRPRSCSTTPRRGDFRRIPGYPKGFRVLTNFFGGKRQNMTLGFPTGLNRIELSEAFLADLVDSEKPLPYEVSRPVRLSRTSSRATPST